MAVGGPAAGVGVFARALLTGLTTDRGAGETPGVSCALYVVLDDDGWGKRDMGVKRRADLTTARGSVQFITRHRKRPGNPRAIGADAEIPSLPLNTPASRTDFKTHPKAPPPQHTTVSVPMVHIVGRVVEEKFWSGWKGWAGWMEL